MLPNSTFAKQPKPFWANVRSISQYGGYTDRKSRQIRLFTVEDMVAIMASLHLGSDHLLVSGTPTPLALSLQNYFAYRAEILNSFVEPRLMNADRARRLYDQLYSSHTHRCPLPRNKQKGAKSGPAYLTCIVNMLIEANSHGLPVDYDPRRLTTIVFNDAPLRSLSRRVDGCFPSSINPIAIWEIKEYYYTTTFGSRVADGVYETLLDGMELEELRAHENIDVRHVLIVDSHYTWWECGRSYLCRLIDMLHMGYVDEILFGEEVVDRIPEIMKEWVTLYRTRE